MKQVTIKHFISMMLVIGMAVSCQKETGLEKNPAADNAAISETNAMTERTGTVASTAVVSKGITPICSVCDANTKAINLLDQLKTAQLKDGSNTVRDLGNGLKAVAQVQKGQITQWLLQDKTGRTYTPQSTEKRGEQSFRPGTGYINVFVICYFTPYGWYCIWVVWG